MQVTGKVYQVNGTGKPYTVIIVNGERIVVLLERSNKMLPVTI